MSIPRPEHPRPDRCRDNYLNLNGTWDFAFDPEANGEKEQWHISGKSFPGKITVPFVPESKLSGIHDENFHKACWYKREFKLPQKMRTGRQLLHFGAVDHYAKVWLNDKLLGDHKGAYSSFCFDVTDSLNAGVNTICVFVEDDPAVNKCRGKQMPYPHRFSQGCRYMRMTGIWQTVWIEQVGETYIDDFRIQTNISESSVNIKAGTAGSAAEGLRLDAKAYWGVERDYYLKGQSSTKLKSGGDSAALTLKLDKPFLWTPDEPNIYYLRLELKDKSGAVVDSLMTYFGMREISIEKDRIFLNNEQIYLLGALDQGMYPDSLYTPPSDEVQKKDVILAKECGLNWIRKHQIMPEPRFFYWCDRLGLMVWVEMPDWGGRREDYVDDGADIREYDDEAYIAEMQDTFMRDINHPSIIGWCCNNERKLQDDMENTRSKKRIYDAMKKLDSSRMVIDNSGYCHAESDICDLHVQWHQERAKGLRTIRKLHETGNNTGCENLMAYCPPYKWRGEPIVISETGNWNIADCPPLEDWEAYGDTLATVEDWIQLYREYFTWLVLNKDLGGFCYVQLYDTEGENNGYFSYDRKEKVPIKIVKSIHENALKRRLTGK